MAESERRKTIILNEQLDHELTCTVCVEYFKDPVILPCSHSFCITCIKGIIRHSGQQVQSFDCPLCRQKIHLKTPNITDDFPKNLALENLVKLHTETSSSFPDELFESVLPELQFDKNCYKHNEPLCLFCSTCSNMVCSKCLEVGPCSKHLPRPLQDICKQLLERSIVNLFYLKEHQHKLLEENYMLETYCTEIDKHEQHLKATLTSECEELMAQLKKKYDVLKEILHLECADLKKDCTKEKQRCISSHLQIKSAIEIFKGAVEETKAMLGLLRLGYCDAKMTQLSKAFQGSEPLPSLDLPRWRTDHEIPEAIRRITLKKETKSPASTRDPVFFSTCPTSNYESRTPSTMFLSATSEIKSQIKVPVIFLDQVNENPTQVIVSDQPQHNFQFSHPACYEVRPERVQCLKEYENKSFEELRHEDYRKGKAGSALASKPWSADFPLHLPSPVTAIRGWNQKKTVLRSKGSCRTKSRKKKKTRTKGAFRLDTAAASTENAKRSPALLFTGLFSTTSPSSVLSRIPALTPELSSAAATAAASTATVSSSRQHFLRASRLLNHSGLSTAVTPSSLNCVFSSNSLFGLSTGSPSVAAGLFGTKTTVASSNSKVTFPNTESSLGCLSKTFSPGFFAVPSHGCTRGSESSAVDTDTFLRSAVTTTLSFKPFSSFTTPATTTLSFKPFSSFTTPATTTLSFKPFSSFTTPATTTLSFKLFTSFTTPASTTALPSTLSTSTGRMNSATAWKSTTPSFLADFGSLKSKMDTKEISITTTTAEKEKNPVTASTVSSQAALTTLSLNFRTAFNGRMNNNKILESSTSSFSAVSSKNHKSEKKNSETYKANLPTVSSFGFGTTDTSTNAVTTTVTTSNGTVSIAHVLDLESSSLSRFVAPSQGMSASEIKTNETVVWSEATNTNSDSVTSGGDNKNKSVGLESSTAYLAVFGNDVTYQSFGSPATSMLGTPESSRSDSPLDDSTFSSGTSGSLLTSEPSAISVTYVTVSDSRPITFVPSVEDLHISNGPVTLFDSTSSDSDGLDSS
ncbi:nuclear pore complex protein DDB_G0274915-like isoform X2 [Gigantopelta aegis]|nr:nuclear pore complex protein DDB_G0274915-like isoform X2 [Gigantopelta aegis]XP_041359533.1 nuclear pore complex protein DDB_G0274915-like isoform X2 [Gigantopelta aegis]XP_041359535.1 nuclear pore complex protein DDB_G0274915-like isoform X2 [Gigantopelta aegis]XP_041359536.1 nuclear pore complex protein DDB_G0274915-like isoform X2 [Gigantopelta aegis]XP_041359537.1 nuclear pore complex protein DDB_G0274915-like isoform X2 [Gigantopelta aegis]